MIWFSLFSICKSIQLKGSLKSWLKRQLQTNESGWNNNNNNNNSIKSGRWELIPIAIDVASAMLFLHSANKPILHCDLKADNCLLTKNNQAKIAGIVYTFSNIV